ncbi:MAG TPA: bifunctional UDP-3-O-[3-hydroxymyristoyl] N-acetylglucosamine deacetylase/3-hydroxyacyl-ACP dehydratase [Flavobacteriaceae bacterium]|jgi:UDP-3-O-[3-hydroxymyristoyl] N-acetylglucosamine deacetylase/3-hydroxyacyl-[acyl-carrier-protein] dehydratase|nr:bifunctional UDP-3-O-[3-hydroxymyristoyl] N-acetylglucosamine deacetylase/3-hydroxyacyl-ACP dehydratase [Flavobacteriaceae bacterium]
MAKQQTILKSVSLKGVGIHSGNEVNLTFKPAEDNFGYAFCRMDMPDKPIIEADINYVVNTKRGTTLEKNGINIQTSEHVLAALVGLEIDNVLIELDAAEPPIMDGSSKYFVEALIKAGIKEQSEDRVEYIVKDVISFYDEDSGSDITVIPSKFYEITTMVDFGTKILGTQNATMKKLSQFKTDFAHARTFSFLHEIEMLLDNGLIKGGDINNAIVYVEKELSKETMLKLRKVFNTDKLAVQSNGILNNLTLHYPNEAARHKLLDVIGDLALIGTRIKGKVIANKPGHYVNTMFAKRLASIIKNEKRNVAPVVDLSKPPVMDVNQIMKILPHRPPFLLVDKILEISDKHIIGLKNITINEEFFNGHFPERPIMPGVLQIEAMAQAGGVLILNTVSDPENYLTFFAKIENAKFKYPVVPGDTLIFKCELLSPLRRGIVHMKARAFVEGKLTSEAELTAKIIRNT